MYSNFLFLFPANLHDKYTVINRRSNNTSDIRKRTFSDVHNCIGIEEELVSIVDSSPISIVVGDIEGIAVFILLGASLSAAANLSQYIQTCDFHLHNAM